jgi:non-ribosomal peptide synthetase component E (peptide arylation enzyme)
MGVDGHLAWDFSEFDRHISALARGLVGLGVKKGDRVGVVMGNTRYLSPSVITAYVLFRDFSP